MMKPEYDIEGMIGLRQRHPKRYYHRFHSGSIIFAKKNLNLIHGNYLMKLALPNEQWLSFNCLRRVLIEVLCSNGSRLITSWKYWTVSAAKLGKQTGWFECPNERPTKMRVLNVITMGDYELHSAISSVCRKGGLCKDLTRIIRNLVVTPAV